MVPVVGWRLEEVCPWPSLPSLAGYSPSQPWHNEPASEGQVKYLRSFGLEVPGPLTKGQAGYLIDQAREYEAAFPPPATPGQKGFLPLAGPVAGRDRGGERHGG